MSEALGAVSQGITTIVAGQDGGSDFPLHEFFARLESAPPAVPPELAARLAHMEQAIDAIAVEVERISEGQRFTTKLLAERAQADRVGSAPGPERRNVTPH